MNILTPWLHCTDFICSLILSHWHRHTELNRSALKQPNIQNDDVCKNWIASINKINETIPIKETYGPNTGTIFSLVDQIPILIQYFYRQNIFRNLFGAIDFNVKHNIG